MSNYPLRLPKTLLEDARELAKDQGVSMNAFLSTLVAERVGEMKALVSFQARAERADLAKAMAILDQAPDRGPLAGDEPE
jgi:hypothetical protein